MNQSELVSQATTALNRLGSHVGVNWHRDDDGADTAAVTAPNFRLQLYINSARALSLEFELAEQGQPPLRYAIDSDLYDLSQPKYEEFAREIGQQIVQFLESLATGRVQVGTFQGKRAMVVPLDDQTVLIYRGRFSTTTRSVSAKDMDRRSDLRPAHDAGPAG